MKSSRRFTAAALSPSVLLLLVVLVVPTAYVLNLMFQRYSLSDVTGNRYIGLENFIRFVQDNEFLWAAVRSFLFSAVSIAVSIPLGLGIALLIRRRLRGSTVFQSLLIVPMVLASLVVGAVFRFILRSGGLLDWSLGLSAVNATALLGQQLTSLVTVALVDAWQWTPFVAIVAAAAMESLPKQVIEAARLDGANAWQEFWHFTLPLIRPLLVIVALIRFMDSFREFDKVYIMTSGGPGISSETLPVYLWKVAFQYFDMGYAAAIGFAMLILISIVSTIIVQRFRATRGVAE
jgi:multiple sugar transport system permease protein